MQSLRPLQRQAGATLIVALIFLVVLTAAGITAVRFATNDERMASSNQFRNTAYQQGQTEIRSQLLGLSGVANRQPLISAKSGEESNGGSDEANDPNWKNSKARFPELRKPIALATKVSVPTTGDNAQTTTLRSVGPYCGNALEGYSLTEGFTCERYEIRAQAKVGGALSDQAQGLLFLNK